MCRCAGRIWGRLAVLLLRCGSLSDTKHTAAVTCAARSMLELAAEETQLVEVQDRVTIFIAEDASLVLSQTQKVCAYGGAALTRFPECLVFLPRVVPFSERQGSVYNALQKVDVDASLVCIHDAARPLVTKAAVCKARYWF